MAQDRIMQGKIPIATDGDMSSVYSAKWHFIHHQKDGDQLYDVEHDPSEARDLAKSAGAVEVIRKLVIDSTAPPAAGK